jgi:hypothetical protein
VTVLKPKGNPDSSDPVDVSAASDPVFLVLDARTAFFYDPLIKGRGPVRTNHPSGNSGLLYVMSMGWKRS